MTIEELKKTVEKLGVAVDQASGEILVDWENIPFAEDDRPYWAALSSIKGIGPGRLPLLIAAFGCARNVLFAKRRELIPILTAAVVEAIGKFISKQDIPSWYQKACSPSAGMRLQFLVPKDPQFPAALRSISHGPTQLWVLGDMKALSGWHIAVVGTRKITPYGREVTNLIARDLAANGVKVVSGLMYGVDETAMRAALAVKGTVVGVWAGGIFPASLGSRYRLAMDVVVQHGAVISEFAPSEFPSKGTFPARNRIVSGLSLGVVVTEGASQSGSLITAEHAIEQGKPVFAVPGPITSLLSAGPNELLKLGAVPVTSAQDVLLMLGLTAKSRPAAVEYQPTNQTEIAILTVLRQRQMTTDEMIRATGGTAERIGEALTNLELAGAVKQIGEEWKLAAYLWNP